MNNEMQLQWTKEGGTFKDAHGTKCTISPANWIGQGHIYITAVSGAVVLSAEMCAELALVLGYVAFTNGELPEPDTDQPTAKEDT